jgi:hypothetical protein
LKRCPAFGQNGRQAGKSEAMTIPNKIGAADDRSIPQYGDRA